MQLEVLSQPEAWLCFGDDDAQVDARALVRVVASAARVLHSAGDELKQVQRTLGEHQRVVITRTRETILGRLLSNQDDVRGDVPYDTIAAATLWLQTVHSSHDQRINPS